MPCPAVKQNHSTHAIKIFALPFFKISRFAFRISCKIKHKILKSAPKSNIVAKAFIFVCNQTVHPCIFACYDTCRDQQKME